MKLKKILVIGDTGFLGSSLKNNLSSNSLTIHFINRTLFDLSKAITPKFAEFLKYEKFQYVVICAAITDVELCYREQSISKQVNVDGTQALLELVSQAGSIPVFFSSDYVFSGKNSPYNESDPRLPQTIYGHHKLSTEIFLENNFANYLTFRTSKLMSKTNHQKNILYPVIRDLSINKASRCFEDQMLNPVFVEDIAEILKAAFIQGLAGTYHLGTRRIFSRFELGRFLASSLGYDTKLIEPIRMTDIRFSEKRPTNNALRCQKVEEALSDLRLLI
ncbi:MAG: SDR family oxidoreductase [Bacteriovorax sp.]|nr:SDR family oxidoreductase [Bacteriovorax sp.]